MEKISDGKGGFLYCSVDCNPSYYNTLYNSSEECFEDIKCEIIQDVEEMGYNEHEKERVLNHYEITLNMSNVEWKDLY